ncbi:hypothetical protein CLD22_08550 [Rubrivivax gelatinosus]|nr:hypothetical protein [Rubrivivax gelatinosus]
MTSPNPPAAPLDPAANPVDPVTGTPGADVGGQPATTDAGIARRVDERAKTPGDPGPAGGSSPGGAPPVDDEGVLESLGKAISSPVREAAASEDPALPPAGGKT